MPKYILLLAEQASHFEMGTNLTGLGINWSKFTTVACKLWFGTLEPVSISHNFFFNTPAQQQQIICLIWPYGNRSTGESLWETAPSRFPSGILNRCGVS